MVNSIYSINIYTSFVFKFIDSLNQFKIEFDKQSERIAHLEQRNEHQHHKMKDFQRKLSECRTDIGLIKEEK